MFNVKIISLSTFAVQYEISLLVLETDHDIWQLSLIVS